MAKSGKGAGKSLVRANLAIHEPPTGTTTTPGALMRTFGFRVQPGAASSLTQRTQWTATPTAAVRKAAKPQFMGAEPREMTLEIFLDSSTKPGGNTVLKKVESLLRCCEVTAKSLASDQPSPPWVVFEWGSFSTARFTAYVASIEASYTLFGTTGIPIRPPARCTWSRSPARPGGRTRPPARSPPSACTGSSRATSLQSLAWREYGSANAWRAIAEANGIDDPSHLPSGTELMLPAAEEVPH